MASKALERSISMRPVALSFLIFICRVIGTSRVDRLFSYAVCDSLVRRLSIGVSL